MDDRRAARGPESGFTAAGSAQSGRRSTFPPWARGRSSRSPPPRPEGYVRPRGASPARNRRSPPRRPASRRCRSRSALRRKLSSDMRRSGHTMLARPFHPRKALLIHPPGSLLSVAKFQSSRARTSSSPAGRWCAVFERDAFRFRLKPGLRRSRQPRMQAEAEGQRLQPGVPRHAG